MFSCQSVAPDGTVWPVPLLPTGKKLVAPLDTIVLLNDVSCNAIRKLSERLLGDTFKCFINLTFLSCCDLSCWYYMVKMMPFVLFDSHSAWLVRWYYSLWDWFQPFWLLSRNFNWANWNVSSKTPLNVRYRRETSVLSYFPSPDLMSLFKISSHVYSAWSHRVECCSCRRTYRFTRK
jgi:hypothetical protein